MSKTPQHGKLALMPYTIQDGIPSMSDSYIMGMYDLMEKHHMLRWVFFSGGINSKEEWLAFIKKRVSPYFAIVDWSEKDADDYPKTYGHVLLTECKAKAATVHFCFFRCNDKPQYTAKFCKEVMEIMDYTFLQGIVPATNWRINKFNESVPGCKKLAVLPNAAWDAKENKVVDAVLYHFEGVM